MQVKISTLNWAFLETKFRVGILFGKSAIILPLPLENGKIHFQTYCVRWWSVRNNTEQDTDSIILQEWRMNPLGWMTVLEVIKGILSPSDCTEIQLLNSLKEGNQWDRRSHHKTAEASNLFLQDCQILPSAGLHWIKYSLRLLWPPANSNSLSWAHGGKHTKMRILRDMLQSYIWKVYSGLCFYHTT